MLTEIVIKNFAIIAEVTVNFSDGFTVVTGETGAGKSIIIDALGLCLGGRADSHTLRVGSDRADISARFDVSHLPAARTWLQTHELEEETSCLIRRTVGKDGRSKSYINGRPVTLAQTRDLGELLVNIHGQHENQTLLKRENQRALLDEFAQHDQLLSAVAQRYDALQQHQQQLKKLQEINGDAATLALLNYQVSELTELQLGQDEVVELEREHKFLSNSDQLRIDCQAAIARLIDDEDNLALSLHAIKQRLSPHQMLAKTLQSSYELLQGAHIQIVEAGEELQHYLDGLDLNPERLSQVEQRLQKIYDLARKHHVTPDALYPLQESLQAKLATANNSQVAIEHCQQAIQHLRQEYSQHSKALSVSRKRAATQLATEVTAHIQQLGMPQGQFSIRCDFSEDEGESRQGGDRILFEVCANPGLGMAPLHKVASGGELSRISLAIQVATISRHHSGTLIFDEVDVGIGGATAEIVGQLLRQLSAKAQIFCVTHLPQVAALGQHHLNVRKNTGSDATTLAVNFLTPDERIQEIARMLGGVKLTKNTLAHAEEMLNLQACE
jgi:DNA repair protein RecN (Recombination protein N)